jgi:hypothetical protein
MFRKLVFGLVLLILAFLSGFVPEYQRLRQARANLSTTAGQLDSCQLGQQLSQIRDAASLTYLEATRKNYGVAGQHSKQLFDQSQHIVNSTGNETLRSTLNDVGTKRDSVTAALANGDAAVIPDLQMILIELEEKATF